MYPDYFRDDVFRIETQRLWLRWPTASDAPAIERLAGEREVSEHTARTPYPYPPGEAQAFVLRARKANVAGEALMLALALRQKPANLIGVIGLEGADDSVELGYWLGRIYWGAGIASEAVTSLLDMIWLATDIQQIDAGVARANPKSRRVLEKAGFVATGDVLWNAPAREKPMPSTRFELRRSRPRFGAVSARALSDCGAGL